MKSRHLVVPYAAKGFDALAPLTEARMDNFLFQVTWNPFEEGSCIIWMRDSDKEFIYNALGKFKAFERRKCLEFMVKYSTNHTLRAEIERRKFARKAEGLTLDFLRRMELMSKSDREAAYRKLFDLDVAAIELSELARRRRSMTKRFHPDTGGDHKAMSLINEAYDYLAKHHVSD